jgi:mono/diheme cytochrome c family protein
MKAWIKAVSMVFALPLVVVLISADKPGPGPAGAGASLQGAALYKVHCVQCHGQDAKGDGPMAKALKVSPPDLTHISAQNRGHFPLARVEKIIAGEGSIPGAHGTREMPVWAPIFSQILWDQDLGQVRVYNLARYIEEKQVK